MPSRDLVHMDMVLFRKEIGRKVGEDRGEFWGKRQTLWSRMSWAHMAIGMVVCDMEISVSSVGLDTRLRDLVSILWGGDLLTVEAWR